MHRKLIILAAVIGTVFGISFAALAQTTPEHAYEYREAVMTALRGHIGAASRIVRGQVEDDGYLLKHAEGLASSASELHRLFPAGSGVEGSEALPAIWSDPDAFAAAIENAEAATAAFVEVAGSGDKAAIGAGFREVGMACRGCHDNFRVADE